MHEYIALVYSIYRITKNMAKLTKRSGEGGVLKIATKCHYMSSESSHQQFTVVSGGLGIHNPCSILGAVVTLV